MRLKATLLATMVALGISSQAHASDLIVNGDFSAGNTGFTSGYGLSNLSPYYFENAVHGIYQILPIGDVGAQAQYGDWTNVTTDPFGGSGNVLAADGSETPGTVVWQETVAVVPNTTYVFSFYAAEISDACCSNAVLVPTIDGTSGSGNTLAGSWNNYTFTWDSGSNSAATISLTDSNDGGGFNDFVLSGLSFLGTAPGVPEPSTWATMLLGFAVVGVCLRKRAEARTMARRASA